MELLATILFPALLFAVGGCVLWTVNKLFPDFILWLVRRMEG